MLFRSNTRYAAELTTVPETGPFAELVDQARAIKQGLERRLARQAAEHPDWCANVDARSAGLQSLWNALRFAELSLHFIDRYLGDPDWWQAFRGADISIKRVTFEYTAYSQGSKFGALHLAAGAFENATRALLRAIAPGAANDARAEFQGVYTALLRSHLVFPDDDVQLLELIRLTRNTIHNEGVHRPPSGKPAAVVYRGVTYEFTESAPVEFVTWNFVLEAIADLVDLLDRVVEAPLVRSHRAVIPAPWASLPAPSAA